MEGQRPGPCALSCAAVIRVRLIHLVVSTMPCSPVSKSSIIPTDVTRGPALPQLPANVSDVCPAPCQCGDNICDWTLTPQLPFSCWSEGEMGGRSFTIPQSWRNGLMLGRRCRRWPNIKPTLGQCKVFPGHLAWPLLHSPFHLQCIASLSALNKITEMMNVSIYLDNNADSKTTNKFWGFLINKAVSLILTQFLFTILLPLIRGVGSTMADHVQGKLRASMHTNLKSLLKPSSATSRKLPTQFSVYRGWRWLEVGDKLNKIACVCKTGSWKCTL